MKIERNVGDGGSHGADERGAAEEECPAVAVAELLQHCVVAAPTAAAATCRWLLAVCDLVVDGRDVKYDAHTETQRCQPRHNTATDMQREMKAIPN